MWEKSRCPLTQLAFSIIIHRLSGCGEAWYRAWFGSKRPRVRIPPLRPYKDGYFDTNNRPYFLPLYPQIAYLSVFSQKEGVLGGISSAVDALFLLFIDFWLKG